MGIQRQSLPENTQAAAAKPGKHKRLCCAAQTDADGHFTPVACQAACHQCLRS